MLREETVAQENGIEKACVAETGPSETGDRNEECKEREARRLEEAIRMRKLTLKYWRARYEVCQCWRIDFVGVHFELLGAVPSEGPSACLRPHEEAHQVDQAHFS